MSIICSSDTELLREFDGWKHVPDDLKTRRQWERAGRKVRKNSAPVARIVYPKVVEGWGYLAPDEQLLESWDGGGVVTSEPTPLFHFDQTAPYRPGPRMLAYWAFEDIFLRYARKDCWIRKTDRHGEEQDDWLTESEFPYDVPHHEKNRLTDDLVRKHINQRQMIGVKGDRLTRFVVIDLDLHGRSEWVFLEQARILLDRFHGVDTWHYQVKHADVTGLQLVGVFPEPQELAAVHREVRAILKELDAQHPELADEARAAGMKALADLELYPTQRRASDDHELETPDNGNGVRLPLCRGRVMLLDRPLALVTERGRTVQDVVGYIRWLEDPDRRHMPKYDILEYLRTFASGSHGQTPKAPKKPAPAGDFDQSRWKGNLHRWLYDFWIEGEAHDRPLNEHIAVLCRLAAAYGYSKPEIVQRVGGMVRALPPSARSCSARLLKGKLRNIDAVIRNTAKYACDGNGHQPDAKKSTGIFAAALMSRPGFDPLDPATWDAPVAKVSVTPNWTDPQRRRLCAFLRKPLFVKDHDLIIRFVNGIVNLTLAKEREGNGWGKEYLLKLMKEKFPEIKCAKDEKRLRIIKSLEAEGIIRVKYRGRAGMYATHWTLGDEAKLALGITNEAQKPEPDTISQECPQALLFTSTNYGSLFAEEGLLLRSGCKVGGSGNNGQLSLSGGQAEQSVNLSMSGVEAGYSVRMPSVSRPLEVAADKG